MLLAARLLPAGQRRQQLQQALEAMFREDFSGRVLPFDTAAAADYADVVHARRNAGRPISQINAQTAAQTAAIALCRGAGLATRKVADFEGCGLAVDNPWNHRA